MNDKGWQQIKRLPRWLDERLTSGVGLHTGKRIRYLKGRHYLYKIINSVRVWPPADAGIETPVCVLRRKR